MSSLRQKITGSLALLIALSIAGPAWSYMVSPAKFPFKDLVYSVNCSDSNALVWTFRADDPQILRRHAYKNPEKYTHDYSDIYIGANDILMKGFEISTLFVINENTARVIDQWLPQGQTIRDGKVLAEGRDTIQLNRCVPDSNAAKFVNALLAQEKLLLKLKQLQAQKQALEQNRLNEIESKRQAAEEKKYVQELQRQCPAYTVFRQTCATAPDYERCMVIRFNGKYNASTDNWCYSR